MMKVLLLTEGGKNIGFGHMTRCLSLYQAFEEKGMTSKIIVNGDNSSLNLLKDKDYLMFDWLKEEKRLLKLSKKSGVTIIDSYLANRALYEEVLQSCNAGLLVMIDDYKRMDYPEGIIINPSIYGEKLDYPKKDGLVYLLGRDYIVLRKAFWDIPEKIINKEIKNILITFGGMSYSSLLYGIIEYIKKEFDFNFCIIEGSKGCFRDADMLRLMLQADICISGGGQTTYELARVGLPTIGICFAENQKLNLEGWQEKGFIEYIGWYNDKNLFKKIKESLKKIDYEKRLKMSESGRRYVDGKGAKRIIENILKYTRL